MLGISAAGSRYAHAHKAPQHHRPGAERQRRDVHGVTMPTAAPSNEIRSQRRAILALLISFAALLVWSAIRPHDYFTWFLEIWPALVGIAVLAATYRRFRFTTFVYGLLWAHAVILLVGGHYTYALLPMGDWMRAFFHLARNDYDRIGHFAQGFVPA